MIGLYKKSCRTMTMIILVLFVTTLLAGCKTQPASTNIYEKNVKAAAVSNSSITLNVEYAGKTKPLETVTIASKIPGKVISIKADIGSTVQKGDVLFKLDPQNAAAQLQQSKAAIDTAQATLAQVKDSTMGQKLLELDTAVNQAQIQYDDAKRAYEKTQALYSSDAASKQQLDDAESAYKKAGIQLDTAKQNLALLKEKIAPQSTEVAATQLEQAQAAYQTAAIQVNDTTVTAPITGIISAKNISQGEVISGGLPAFTLINTEKIIIEINVPDTILPKLHSNQTVPVVITALEGKTFNATIDTISPAANALTGTYIIKLKLNNPDNVIKPGMFASVQLPIEHKDNVITVPNEALVVEDGIQYVYVVENNTVKKLKVTIGLSNDRITEITSGLKLGDLVITEGQSFLNEGEAVKISK